MHIQFSCNGWCGCSVNKLNLSNSLRVEWPLPISWWAILKANNKIRTDCSEAWCLLTLRSRWRLTMKVKNQYYYTKWCINTKCIQILPWLHRDWCMYVCLCEIHVTHSYTTKHNQDIISTWTIFTGKYSMAKLLNYGTFP